MSFIYIFYLNKFESSFFHKGNKIPAIPFSHAVHMAELPKVSRGRHWTITRAWGEFTKVYYFLCFLESCVTKSHYHLKEWFLIDQYRQREAHTSSWRDLFPPLRIKHELMKNVVKAINKEGDVFKPLNQIFPRLGGTKLKEYTLNYEFRKYNGIDSLIKN